MSKQLTASIIIASIFILAMKDSASFVHTLLHYIPNNPWHQHAPVVHRHKINPMEIHKYLQQKHAHTHEHGHTHEHEHTHAHNVMDHIHANEGDSNDAAQQINQSLKIDLYVQAYPDFLIQGNKKTPVLKHTTLYSFSRITHSPCPPFQPPQV